MTTDHVLEHLPLWIEGDLPTQSAVAVEAHLADCPACHLAAERLRASQGWLRAALEPPFDAADFADLRQKVMGQIRLEQARPRVRRITLPPPLLAACAAALLVAGLAWHQERPRVAVPAPPRSGTPPAAVAADSPAGPFPPPIRQARLVPARMRPTPHEAADASSENGPARMEFQIPDSNIRIIWLAQATPLPNHQDAL